MKKVLTEMDITGARLTLKKSINPKEIEAAQKVLKQYKEQERSRRAK